MDLLINKEQREENKNSEANVSNEEAVSVFYHDIFDYPLTFSEIIRWKAGPESEKQIHGPLSKKVIEKNGYYFLQGKEGIILKRLLRERISARKIKTALKAANILSLIPTIKMVGITGALAMENADDASDIDLLIITKSRTLWTTRPLAIFLLNLFGVPVRKADDKFEKDKICPNMWIDEKGLTWRNVKTKKYFNRNAYTAHEIAQIIPLLDRNDTYEKFLLKNRWIRGFWPNAVNFPKMEPKILKSKQTVLPGIVDFFLSLFEKAAFWLQYRYMKKRITREQVSASRAFFHPIDWGNAVLSRLTLDKEKVSY